MRIAVDTKVLVGACLGSVSCGGVLRACIDGRAVRLMGTTLLAELEDVLGRQQLFQRSRLSAEERNELLDIVLAHCQWVRIFYGWRPNLPDEGDNHLVELRLLVALLPSSRATSEIFPARICSSLISPASAQTSSSPCCHERTHRPPA